jgi:hypothetical protein
VRALVSGRYEVRTERFTSLVADVAAALSKLEQRLQEGGNHTPPDYPSVPEYLGRAHEILGNDDLAIAAYERAERKYLAWAAEFERHRREREAEAYRQGAASVRARRLLLQEGEKPEGE